MSNLLQESLERLEATAKAKKEKFQSFLQSQPAEIPCTVHPNMTRHLDAELSAKASAEAWAMTAAYTRCPICEAIHQDTTIKNRLEKNGVPSLLTGATFDNWTPRDDAEAEQRDRVREFCNARRGFLLLCGSIGTGKSHLAIAALRAFDGYGWFVTQSGFLRALRETYQDENAPDPIVRAKRASLFILDEAGVSVGGRDEGPALYDVLDHRHQNFKPTIITSNLPAPEACRALGERLHDRIRQGLFAILNFDGASNRLAVRGAYFER